MSASVQQPIVVLHESLDAGTPQERYRHDAEGRKQPRIDLRPYPSSCRARVRSAPYRATTSVPRSLMNSRGLTR